MTTATLHVDIVETSSEGAVTLTKQSASKAWLNMNGKNTIAIRDSFNISGIIDNGTGDYNGTLVSNMANDDYSQVASSHNSGTSWSDSPYTGGKTTSALDIQTGNTGGIAADSDIIDTIACGDLA